jgi:hypothetical protein
MHALVRLSARAFLPALVLGFCHGCGGGGSGGSGAQGSAPSPAPAPAPAPGNNRAPTISGTAAGGAQVGVHYEFQPVAADPDGDAVTFSAANLPPWATLDGKTGKLSGTPESSDVGEYESITITVADATHETATSPFNIVVTGSANGVASLRWEKPMSHVDGSMCDDLAGYRIVYGRSAGEFDHSIYINDPAQTQYEFATLDSGTWYFAVIGVTASGLEGPPTTVATKSI